MPAPEGPKAVTLYQSRTPGGSVRGQVAGLTLAVAEGGFGVSAHALGGVKPKAGDTLRDSSGKTWRVTGAELASGVWNLTCEAEAQ